MLQLLMNGEGANFPVVDIQLHLKELFVNNSVLLGFFDLFLFPLELLEVVVILVDLAESAVLANVFSEAGQTRVRTASFVCRLLLLLSGEFQGSALLS